MSMKSKSEWVGEDGLLLKGSLEKIEKIAKDLTDPDLKSEWKATCKKAAEEKAEKISKYLQYI